MGKIEKFHAYMSAHLALNCALLVKNVRSAFQIDNEDHPELRSVLRGLRKVAGVEVEYLTYDTGYTLLRLAEQKLPPQIEAAWRRLRAGAHKSKAGARKDVGIVLGLKCPAADFADSRSFSVKMIFQNLALNEHWNFKQQMCVSPDAVPRLWNELRSYENVGNEMGFDAVMMQLQRNLVKGRRALELGPHLKT